MKPAGILTDRWGGPRRPYEWPASRLTDREMFTLYDVKARTGLPVNELIRRAVAQVYCKPSMEGKADAS